MLTDEQVQRSKRALLKKGAEINEKLTQLLAGQRVSIPFVDEKAGESPIERLRRFMGIVDAALRRIAAGSYGRCVECGEPLPWKHLEQIPWIDTCQACAAKAAKVE